MKNIVNSRHWRKTSVLSWALLAGLSTTQLTGCFTVGQEFAAGRVPEIKIGQTRKQDVHEMFGMPWRTGMEDGRPTWTYGIYKYALFGATDSQDLLVRFDPQGIVRSYTFSSTRVKNNP